MALTVLIADNSEFSRRLVRELVGAEHEIVAEAENGVEAVERYEETDPDLVVMDVGMPIKDGIAATGSIKSSDPDATVILCAGPDENDRIDEAREAGADGCLVKPFQRSGLASAIEDAIPAPR